MSEMGPEMGTSQETGIGSRYAEGVHGYSPEE